MVPRHAWIALLAAILCFADAVSAQTLRSGSELDYPPFSLVDDQGRADGFSVELLRASLRAMNRDVTFDTGPWSEVRGWLESGQVDVLPLVGRTPEREPLFDFTFPYISLHGAIVVREAEQGIRTLDDLVGRRVGVMAGDNAEEFLHRTGLDLDLHTTLSFEEALRQLAAGRTEAVVMQRLVALRLLRHTGIEGLQVVDRPIQDFRQDFCFAVREGDAATLALLNEGLSVVMADGTFRRLYAKWYAAFDLPQSGRLIIGVRQDDPPYSFLDEKGELAGYFVDVARALGRQLGRTVELRPDQKPQLRQALRRGEIDAIVGVAYTPERDARFDFTEPDAVIHVVGVVRRDGSRPPTQIADLAGKRVTVRRGGIAADLLLTHGHGARVTMVETHEQALLEVHEGRADVALVARPAATYMIRQRGWEDLDVGFSALLEVESCIAVLEDQKALLANISEGLEALESSGQYREIRRRWDDASGVPTTSPAQLLRYGAMVVVPLLGILLASAFWVRSLRREVAVRTRQLALSESRFRSLFEHMEEGCALHEVVVDDAGKPVDYVFLEVNDAWCALTGLRREAVIGQRVTVVLPGIEADPADWISVFGRVALTGEPANVEAYSQVLDRWYQVHAYCPAEGTFAVVFADVTGRRQVDEALVQSSRLISLGEMAAGMAHELNQPLTVISTLAEGLELRLASGLDVTRERMLSWSRDVSEAVERMGRVIRHLRDFARDRDEEPWEKVALTDVVEGALSMTRAQLSARGIDVHLELSPDLPLVHGDRFRLEQVLINLLHNGRDALEERRQHQPDPVGTMDLTVRTVRNGHRVALEVEDNGVGMNSAVLQRCLEPFYTTKGPDSGMGLGLAITHAIVRDHHGEITCESQPDQGARFRVWLPAA